MHCLSLKVGLVLLLSFCSCLISPFADFDVSVLLSCRPPPIHRFHILGIDCRYNETMHDCLNYLLLGQTNYHRQEMIRYIFNTIPNYRSRLSNLDCVCTSLPILFFFTVQDLMKIQLMVSHYVEKFITSSRNEFDQLGL